MNRNRQIWVDQPHQLHPLFRVHGHHQYRQRGRRDSRATKMRKHQVYVPTLVPFGYLFEVIDHKGVTRDVDAVRQISTSLRSYLPYPSRAYRYPHCQLVPSPGLSSLPNSSIHPFVGGINPAISLAVPINPSGTCFPGIPVTFKPGILDLPSEPFPTASTIMLSKKSNACTLSNASPDPFPSRCDLAWGVVMMGRSRRRESSTT